MLPQARRRQQCFALLLTRNRGRGAGKHLIGVSQRPSPCFGGRFNARSAFSIPLQCLKRTHRQRFPASEIKSIHPEYAASLTAPRFAGRRGFSPSAASRARPFWARDADGAGPKASVGVQRDSIPRVGLQRVKPFAAAFRRFSDNLPCGKSIYKKDKVR